MKEKGAEYVRKKAKELQKRIELKENEEIDMLVKALSKLCAEELKIFELKRNKLHDL